MYVSLPNYRNYWKEAGYAEEMEATEKAASGRERADGAMSERLADVMLFGSAEEARGRLARRGRRRRSRRRPPRGNQLDAPTSSAPAPR
jgi:hypothetical protein